MAELEASKKVQEIPAGQPMPEPVKRSVGVEVSGVPNYQQAISSYAENTNWMSSLGSAVATKASQALAVKLGTDLGSNPQGDLKLPPITDFDKAFAQSYETQATATLGLQANKLISSANIQIAQAPRITPELISSTNHQVSLGLKNIFQNAPAEIRSKLEYQYKSLQVNQTENLMTRMTKEQREDRQNNLTQFSKVSNENLFSMGFDGKDLDKNSDSKIALETLGYIEKSFQSAQDVYDITPEGKKLGIDSAWESYLSGKYSRLGMEALREGKLEDFLQDFAENKSIPTQYHKAVFGNVKNYLSEQVSLRSHKQNYIAQQMVNRMALNPNSVTGQELEIFRNQVAPLLYEQTLFKYIQLKKTATNKSQSITNLKKNWDKPEAHAQVSADVQNATFNELVQYEKENNPSISDDDAKINVAASAGSTIPVYTSTLHKQLNSGIPYEMNSAVYQIRKLQQMKAGHAKTGLNDTDMGIVAQYESLVNPIDPTKAAQIVIETNQNMDEPVLKLTNEKWENLKFANTIAAGRSIDNWILTKFGYKGNSWYNFSFNFDSPYMETLYAADIYNKYKTFFKILRGDEQKATDLTNEYLQANYGLTRINGNKQLTLHPIEKRLGFESGEGISQIHKDVVRQFKEPMDNLKKAYDMKASDVYWTIKEPEKSGQPLIMTKHNRAGLGTTTEEYPVVFTGTNFDEWDVMLKSKNGPFSLALDAPYLGIETYRPDKEWIIDEYMGKYHSFPKEKIAKILYKDYLNPKSDEQILESFNNMEL